ncbi:hypothetical protein PAECIP111892_00709 [Paenibacillus auburnensis]|uniref:Uncharacterized protein n=1 Tax=Paenibacillus auburnensis TaxID=2905649 RepID=A0ABM9BQB9_9BACL|nr:hypothetical protein PAECIP111892_00709 [Paenibacillus auburnensis]
MHSETKKTSHFKAGLFGVNPQFRCRESVSLREKGLQFYFTKKAPMRGRMLVSVCVFAEFLRNADFP